MDHAASGSAVWHACVLFIPDEEMSTTEARAVLPEALPYKDAVFNISRAAMLVNCFATAQFDPLRYAMDDRLHQQYRTHMFPFEPFIKGALQAGAHGAFLSGAGPTVLAIAGGVGIADPGSDTMSQFLAEAVSEAMLDTAREQGISGTVHISTPSFNGVSSIGTASTARCWSGYRGRDAAACWCRGEGRSGEGKPTDNGGAFSLSLSLPTLESGGGRRRRLTNQAAAQICWSGVL